MIPVTPCPEVFPPPLAASLKGRNLGMYSFCTGFYVLGLLGLAVDFYVHEA